MSNEPVVSLLKIRQEVTDESNMLFFDGVLDLSQAHYFRSVVEPFVAQPDKQLIFNLKDMRYIDSTGLGLIISILKQRQSLGQRLEVVEVPPKIMRLLNLTGISKFVFK